MTKALRDKEQTKLLILAIILGLVVIALIIFENSARAEETEPKVIERPDPERVVDVFAGVSYQILNDRMIIEVNQPLMKDRFAMFGHRVLDEKKQGRWMVDVSEESLATDMGKELRIRLLKLSNDKSAGYLILAAVEYNRVTIFKYPRYDWAEVEPLIVEVLQILK
jgi:hypothetical protein